MHLSMAVCLLQQSTLPTAACPLILQCSQSLLREKRTRDYFCSQLSGHRPTTLQERASSPFPRQCLISVTFVEDNLTETSWVTADFLWLSARPASPTRLIICRALPCLTFSVICTNSWWEHSKSLLGKLIVYLRGSTYEIWYPGRDPGISSSSKTYSRLDIKQWIDARPGFCPLVSLSTT